MDFLKDFLGDKSSELVSGLVGKAGFDESQAKKFVPEAASSVLEAAKSTPDLDLSNVAGAAQGLIGKVDTAGLAQRVGIDASQASSGLQQIVPQLLGILKDKAGGASGLLSMLGQFGSGDLGKKLGGIGKLFGK